MVGTGSAVSCDDTALTNALAGGQVTFNCGGAATITVLSAKTITATTTIQGGGLITLTGNSNARLFNVNSGTGLTLRDIILDHARSSGSDGGAIFNLGRLVLENSTIQFSHADLGHSGGATYTEGPLTITNSTLFQNDAGSAGALFAYLANAKVTIFDTRLISNDTNSGVTGFGGAIWVGPQAQPSLSGYAIQSTPLTPPGPAEEWALVSTAPFSTAWQAYSFWRKRWLVENSGFRELKEGWHLEAALWTFHNPVVAAARVAFTLVAFNVAQIARTRPGQRRQARGIRRLRRELNRRFGSLPVTPAPPPGACRVRRWCFCRTAH